MTSLVEMLPAVPKKFPTYWLPTKPYSLVDCLNRMCAATGSVGYAMAAADADYNGHAVGCSWNSFRGYYLAHYTWGEFVRFGRTTDIREMIRTARDFHKTNGRGGSFSITPHTAEDAAILAQEPDFVPFDPSEKPAWRDWRFDRINDVLSTRKHFGLDTFHLLQAATSVEDYDTKVTEALRARRGER